ncbi:MULTISPECIES: flotillin family protein [unclassified Fusibacter]|uniref:flotillin family protein n=1 Tax=unclassified Fusibacter TaxID=2624464 RepID=UPI001011ECB9|nr:MULTISPECIES: flotillin family protein [unclassified Fusibacter]MCK8058956.1 flotillin family protein [Fusibacter sp. A2]NPE22033.1 flotillin family protein [Fusibacter sp. A1]RXV61597.1 flotillin family protein [Fusibacter sp. A1]
MNVLLQGTLVTVGASIVIVVGLLALFASFYHKVEQSKVIIRNGIGNQVVCFGGIMVVPIIHRKEEMDISIKRVEIAREGKDGLICKDNLRADIRVAFFVRVNQTTDDVLKVAQLLGCQKASDPETLMAFFDAKFSEALKTVGKKFDFVQLYTDRETFKSEILQIIGTDLNGYVLDDAAIDYLEQTDIRLLNPDNILDSEGIKKITELTSTQRILANEIEREREKTIKRQDVSAREAILELEKQNAEAEAKQLREISIINSREIAEAEKVAQEERYKSELARVKTEEEIGVAEENKQRQIIIAAKSKESTEAIETERVERKRLLERTEKEKLVELAIIDKEKLVEVEKKNIQTVIRERVTVEKDTVVEEEKIKDTRALADANRTKNVALRKAEEEAETKQILVVKGAEAAKMAAEKEAEKTIIDADANLKAAHKEAEAIKVIVDARVLEGSVEGIAASKVIEAKALAEAKGETAKVEVKEKDGTVEAANLKRMYLSEAEGIKEKANSMKLLDAVGRDHEEFKLKLDKEKQIELAQITIQKDIADAQASVIREALKSAKIDIVGGETMFFDKIIGSIAQGKAVDRVVNNSEVLKDIKETLITGDADYFQQQLKTMVGRFNLSSQDLMNITISGAIGKMMKTAEGNDHAMLTKLLDTVNKAGVANLPANLIENVIGA